MPCAVLVLLAAGCQQDPVDRDVRVLDTPGETAARVQAAKNLGALHDPRVAPTLVRATRAPEQEVRCAAAAALTAQPAADAVPALVAMLGTRLPGRDCAIEPLGQLKDPRGIAPLLAEAARRDTRALDALGGMGEVALYPLVNALRKATDAHDVEAYTRAVLAAGGKGAFEPLQALLLENDRQTKANAAFALGRLGDPRALDALVKAADMGLGTAPAALARLGEPGLQALVARLDHPRPWQRDLALVALAQAEDAAVVPLLEKAMQSASPNVSDDAARVLATQAGLAPPPPGVVVAAALKAPALAALQKAGAAGDTHALAVDIDHYLQQPDGEDTLVEMLEMHGDERLAAAFLRSPSQKLKDAANEWSRQTGRPVCADPAGCAPAPQP
jgi:HEAT repeat protein